MWFLFVFALNVFASSDLAFYNGLYEAPTRTPLSSAALKPDLIQVVQWNVHQFAEMRSGQFNCSTAYGETMDLCDRLRDSDVFLMQESYGFPARGHADSILGVSSKHLSFVPYAVTVEGTGIDDRDLLFLSFDEKAARGLVEREHGNWASATYSSVMPESTVVRMTEAPDQDGSYLPIVATTYALQGRAERLLVLHIHNFAYFIGSSEQLDLLNKAEAMIANHFGPILFAGDFNTWSSDKLNNVYRLAQRQGLYEVYFDSPYCTPFGEKQIDHALVRGLSARDIKVHNSARGVLSDHMAISYTLSVY